MFPLVNLAVSQLLYQVVNLPVSRPVVPLLSPPVFPLVNPPASPQLDQAGSPLDSQQVNLQDDQLVSHPGSRRDNQPVSCALNCFLVVSHFI